jgi:CHASE3 domain sensor protein
MENIIFYTLLLVCIILLFIVGYNFTKINKYRSNVQFWQESFNDVSKRVKELTTKNTYLNTLLGISRDAYIEIYKSAINERNTKLTDQSQLITKLTDELTIKNTTIESLTNHLKEFAKPFDPLAELDKIEVKHISEIVPAELYNKTMMQSEIFESLTAFENKYPEESEEFYKHLIVLIKGSLKEIKTKKKIVEIIPTMNDLVNACETQVKKVFN